MKREQSKKVATPAVAGYPETAVGKDDVLVKGRYMSGTGTKSYGKARGMGAATRGGKFLSKYI